MTFDRESWFGEVASSWWQQHRITSDMSVKQLDDFDDRLIDIAAALFESVFTIDLAIDAFAKQARGPNELSYIGTRFLEDAGEMLGMSKVLEILSDTDLPADSVDLIRSGIDPTLIG